MKFIILILLSFLSSCSFDNKTGIWNNENISVKKNKKVLDEFKTLSSNQILFDKILPLKDSYKFKKISLTDGVEWKDIFYDKTNNFKNFHLSDKSQTLLKSKKISKHETSDYILFDKGNIITTDLIGNLIVFSTTENTVLRKYNFYKKKYKKIKKKLNIIIDNSVLYVSDNLGYFYSYDYKEDRVLWAKNFKIPFRSNLKIFDNKIVAANQNNNLYFLDKKTGEVLKLIPTEENQIKNEFISNISSSNEFSFFLNTYGSLYAIDNKSMRIIWFINLNQSIDLNPSNLFTGNQIIYHNEKIIVTSNRFLYVINVFTGNIIFKKNFSSSIKPFVIDNYLFIITKNDLLVSLDLENGSIIYSYDINQLIADFYSIKKKRAEFKTLMMANNKLLVFLKNSYLLRFNISGSLDKVSRLPTKIKTHPIVVNKSILYIDKKNQLSILN